MNKKSDPINLFIVEHHNNVLNILYRGIGSKKIPFSNLKLLHYDAHPDLGVSNSDFNTIKQNPLKLLSETSIENWILPAVYCGHIDHVIWMRPNFCNQMGDRISQEYNIGYTNNGKKMMTDMNDLYYINEGSYMHTEKMENKIKFKLSVGPIHYTHTMCRFCYDINIQLMNSHFILDIDLDTFAPINPFRDKYTDVQTYLITNLYGFPKSEAVIKAQQELFAQPYPFRLKHVRYPAKKYDGQLNSVPNGTLSKDIADEISLSRSKQLEKLKRIILELQYGVFACNYDSLKLLGLLFSIVGCTKLITYLADLEIKIQMKIKAAYPFNDEEKDILTRRSTFKPVPNSFIRQLDSVFVNERCKNIYYILYELENIFNQLKSQTSEYFYINWSKVSKNSNGTSENIRDGEDNLEDLLLFYHYLFSSCGFEWNGDYDSLPHKPNLSNSSFEDSLNDLTSLLNRLHSPIMITLARSCEDGYLSKDVVDKVENGVIKCLEKVYENRGVNVIRYEPDDPNFTWPSVKRNRNSTKSFNEVTVSFRTAADQLDNKDIL